MAVSFSNTLIDVDGTAKQTNCMQHAVLSASNMKGRRSTFTVLYRITTVTTQGEFVHEPVQENVLMSATAIATVVKMMESLPDTVRDQRLALAVTRFIEEVHQRYPHARIEPLTPYEDEDFTLAEIVPVGTDEEAVLDQYLATL